jgi:RNA recognition motif-containing protein
LGKKKNNYKTTPTRGHGKKSNPGSQTRVYARNLPWGMTEENVKEFFVAGSNVHNIHMIKDHKGRFTGCVFFDVKDAKRAIKVYNNMEWMGRKLYVALANKKAKKDKVVNKNKKKE